MLGVLSVLVSSCRNPGGAKLEGTWLLDSVRPDGVTFHSVVEVSSDGRHICETRAFTNSMLAYTVTSEGTIQIKDGYLIETITKHSEPHVSVPWTNRARIVSLDKRRIVAHDDANSVEMLWKKEPE